MAAEGAAEADDSADHTAVTATGHSTEGARRGKVELSASRLQGRAAPEAGLLPFSSPTEEQQMADVQPEAGATKLTPDSCKPCLPMG